MKRQLLPLFVFGLMSVLLAGCKGAAPSSDEAPSQAPVQAEAAKKIVLGEWTDLLGTTQPLPNHSARISAPVEGRVLSVLRDGKGAEVTEGQQVKAGQVIVRLDDRVLRANRVKLQATLSDLDEQKKQAEFALELATIEVTRLKELLQTNPAGGQIPLVSRVDMAKADVLQKDAQSKLRSVAAKRAFAEADLQALDEQIGFFTLRAPIAGRLSMVQAVQGQTLNPGAVVADVTDLSRIDVLCYAPPHAAAKLALDQPAKLFLVEATAPEHQEPLLGKVAFIAVQAQPETGNVPVKVRFPNPDLRLRANTVVRVYVLTQPEQERLTIPAAAVAEDRDIPAVVAVQDIKTEKKEKGSEEKTLGKVRTLHAVLGIRDRDRSIVELLGLEDPATKAKVAPADLLFVTAGGNGLQNDDVVKIQKAEQREAK
ncbi:MAG TPA: efflux RND transporter periplasmic adaptor subunit [Gemmataceae bacterium]|nr:efflux RND transporter periplasmic adaptor subunit [Gemmataceae bacterium]